MPRDRSRSPDQTQIENQLTTATPPPKETISCATPPKEITSYDPPNGKRKSSPKVEGDLEQDFHLSKKLRRQRSLLAEEMDECKDLYDKSSTKLRREGALSAEGIKQFKALDDNLSKKLRRENSLSAEDIEESKTLNDE